ncbi:MAG: aldo/keto reductase [Pseudomonadota bacterium]
MHETPFRCPSGATLSVTPLGLGGAPLGNLYAAIPEPIAEATLQAAWDQGMRVWDTAPLYGLGLSEERYGRFLRDKPRDAFVLSTKAGRILEDCPPEESTPDKFIDVPSRKFVYDYSYDGVKRSLEQSLERLGLDHVDILLCHDVDVFTHGSLQESDRRIGEFMDGGYRAFTDLRGQGTVEAIGAGINEWEVAEKLARAGDFDVFLLAGRYTLLEQEALESFLPLCVERGIGIMLGGPYNSGILATGAKGEAYYNYFPAEPEIRHRVNRIDGVCHSHGVTLAQAALQFPLAHPSVFTVIPGAKTPAEVVQNVATLTAPIPEDLWQDLRSEGLLHPLAPVPG